MVTINKSTKEKIKQLLMIDAKYRDSDEVLIARMWQDALAEKHVRLQDITAYGLLLRYVKGELPNTESIRRCRQKLQEKFPELQGASYRHRKKKEKVIHEQIKYL